MSHDESLHTRFSWDLYRGAGFAHTPLMHGPLLFHMTALSYFLFGDDDFTSRIYPALLGALLVMFPLLLRCWLGKAGALSASAMLLISPLLLYYSRYIRHDIPAIFFALIMAYSIWRHIERPHAKWMAWLAGGMALLIASKEVAFIYIAIYASFVTLYFLATALSGIDRWQVRWLKPVFWVTLTGVAIVIGALAVFLFVGEEGMMTSLLSGAATVEPADPLATLSEADVGEVQLSEGAQSSIVLAIVAALLLLIISVSSLNLGLRDLPPALDVLMVIGTLILPLLTPFAIKAAGFNPLDETPEGIGVSARFTALFVLTSVLLGAIWGARRTLLGDGPSAASDVQDGSTWAETLGRVMVGNRWWIVGGIYWALFIFFFTTAFTNSNGLGTGVIGSLGYWLEQQGVRRGSQPDYYYALIIATYEFMPLLLTLAAAITASLLWLKKQAGKRQTDNLETDDDTQQQPRETRFPVLMFLGYWTS